MEQRCVVKLRHLHVPRGPARGIEFLLRAEPGGVDIVNATGQANDEEPPELVVLRELFGDEENPYRLLFAITVLRQSEHRLSMRTGALVARACSSFFGSPRSDRDVQTRH